MPKASALSRISAPRSSRAADFSDATQTAIHNTCTRRHSMPAHTIPTELLDPVEKASRDEITALQIQRLKTTLNHVYKNVPHYRKVFDDKGVHPDDLKELRDLAKFPFTSKKDLRDNYPFGLFAVPKEQVSRIHASSGTTGKPTVVGYTRNDISNWADLVARSIRAAGGRAGDTLHIAYGYGL